MWPVLAMAAGSAIGGALQGRSAEKAAQTSANAQLKSAQIAADAARFRPVGVTTRFGGSDFKFDSKGNLISAGYDVSPEVAAMRDRLLSQAGTSGMQTADQALAAQQQLMNLGQGYLAQTPEAAAQQWMQSQQALLAPSREQAWAQLSQGDYNRGTTGLKIAQGGDLLAANPYATALANAQALQDRQLAADAMKEGRAQTTFGTGLFSTGLDIGSAGYNPLKTQFGLSQNLEAAGQDALNLGAQLGGRSAQAGANVGQFLFSGGTNAAKALQQANSYNPMADAISGLSRNPAFAQGISNWMSTPYSAPSGTYVAGGSGTANPYIANASPWMDNRDVGGL
jgi:hypothetical protein